ncbi:MAG: rplI [Rickettsiaceae bacterium]|jgi:large subunit ribosomal protein L9|nr:rplI [Rickettsiaceae bacterium]
MEVILVQPVKTLGTIGQIVKVKDGFGRNYLIPQGKAIRATNENKKLFEAKKAEIEKKNNEAKFAANQISGKLNGQVFTVIKQAGDDGRLFGSVNTKELARLISAKFAEIKHSDIVINEAIKNIGLHEVSIALHSEVQTKVFINVARTESEAQDALRAHTSSQEQDKSTAA